MFLDLIERLGDRYEVIAPDLPGFGLSDPVLEPPSIEAYADAITSLMRSATPGSVAVAGHHTGALVAAELARRDPSGISRLVLMGFPYYRTAEERAARLAAIAPRRIIPQPDAGHLLAEWSRLWALDPEVTADVVHEELIDTLLAPRYDLAYAAALGYDGAAALADLRVPIAVVSGNRDHLHPLQLLMVAELGIPIEVVEGGGVFMCRQMPGEVAAALVRALEAGSD
jgi:pimeloyl-ACP methyl ester carboxylesterase